MAQKVYTVEGRQFRTESDYARAKHDKEIMDQLRARTNFKDKKDLEALRDQLRSGKYKFMTLLGQDFQEEVEAQLKIVSAGKKGKKVISDNKKPVKSDGKKESVKAESAKAAKDNRGSGSKKAIGNGGDGNVKPAGNIAGSRSARPTGNVAGSRSMKTAGSAPGNGIVRATGAAGNRSTYAPNRGGKNSRTSPGRQEPGDDGQRDTAADAAVEEVLRQRERLRKWFLRVCSVVAVLCLGYFGIYSYYNYRTESAFREMNEMKEVSSSMAAAPAASTGPLYTLDDAPAEREVLDEYKKLLNNNKRLIGWLKIDDTNINYPVLQTENNEYYLDHNANEEYDINGSIFMDKDCDVIKPSTNYILYGHHMKNGKMFGKLDAYQNESYYKEHPYISFDTIYEKGTYEVMYVFRSRVYKETEIVFKYYQFIDANGAQEFDSYMREMAAMSLYDTGVTAEYGDQLLTLSTCDYQETDGRFVVVAKKIAKE